VRWAGLLASAWLVAGLVQSIATVTFTGPPAFGLFFGLVGIVAALSDGAGGAGGQSRSTSGPLSRFRVSRTRSA
jgi:hypothetical protein